MPQEFPEEEIHLRDYLNVILKRKWTIITCFVVLVTIVTIASFKMEPVYKATCQILIERENPNVVKIEEVMAIDASSTDYYQTQYEILKSQELAERGIKRLNLYDNKEFNRKPKIGLGTIIAAIRGFIGSTIKNIIGSKKEQKEYQIDKTNQLIKAYLARLDIKPIRNSRLVNISFEAHDPQLAAQIANTHAKLYIEQSLERKFSASKEAVNWLNKRIKEVKEKLQKSEEALRNYKQAHDLVSIDFEESHNIRVQRLNELNTALMEAKTKRIEKENLYRELKRISDKPEMIESMPAVVANPLIQQLKAEYIKIKADYSKLSQRYGPEHPKMIRLRSEIKELKAKIASEVKKIARSIETEYRVAKKQEEALNKALEEEKKKALALSEKEIQYNVLKREVEINRTLYESLLKRAKETNITEDLQVSNVTIVDPARIPDVPFKPKKGLNILLATIVGLTMGIGLAFFLEYLDDTIKTPEEVERYLKIPFLGYVGKVVITKDNPYNLDLVALKEPKSHIAEMLRNIRTNILFSTSNFPRKAILVTSSTQEEGKTFLTINLAISLAQMGKRVVVVDTDLRKPRIHPIFGLKKHPGLTDVLTGNHSLESVIQDTKLENLKIIPCGTIPPDPAELLSSEAMKGLIDKLKEQFDFALFDSPPVMSVTDPTILANLADGVIIVIKGGETPRPPIQRTLQQLSELDTKVLGVVLNGIDFQKGKYYYHYYYKYHYDYDYGEKEVKKGKNKKFSIKSALLPIFLIVGVTSLFLLGVFIFYHGKEKKSLENAQRPEQTVEGKSTTLVKTPFKKIEIEERVLTKRKTAQERIQKNENYIKTKDFQKKFIIYVASFKNKTLADALITRLKNKGYSAYGSWVHLPQGDDWIRVKIGPFFTKEEAEKIRNQIEKQEGISTRLILKENR
ncbi:MAG TPA: polysaccharide biosynthesis tyrosine autokinase [Candidatus Desulfofervidus auxilii]|uniref:non-specific protein-tyrosine kinase n=1 Tax=Desulfofervidus auxilii TaxID=1621989 RepID=A0A7C1VPJ2_DESA2|nr:polysaccharide biosynthesis tyrosine autokinase [Candidatus Desulfofervidus auxilii]